MGKKGLLRTLFGDPDEECLRIEWKKDKPRPDDFVCEQCHYGWTSRKKFGSPGFCPKCRSDRLIKVNRD